MRLFFLSLLILFPLGVYSLTITPIEFTLTDQKVADLGVKVSFHRGQSCGGATEVTAQVPASFRGSSYSGASLEVIDDGKTLFLAGLNLDALESEDAGPGMKGLFFCLDPSLYSASLLRVFYSKGPHTTDVIVINIEEAYRL